MPNNPWHALTLAIVFGLGLASCAAPTAPGNASPEVAQTNALFEEYWEWVLRENPEWTTSLGDRRYDDQLKDESAQAVRRRTATRADFRRRLDAIDTAALPQELRTSVRVLRDQLDRSAAITAHSAIFPLACSTAGRRSRRWTACISDCIT